MVSGTSCFVHYHRFSKLLDKVRRGNDHDTIRHGKVLTHPIRPGRTLQPLDFRCKTSAVVEPEPPLDEHFLVRIVQKGNDVLEHKIAP